MNIFIESLKKVAYAELDIDTLLDSRDSAPFDAEWVRVYKELEALKKSQSVGGTDSTAIREQVFMLVYNMSGSGELAEYVSDDFGLIADAKALNYSDPWLMLLISKYESATIPCGDLRRE